MTAEELATLAGPGTYLAGGTSRARHDRHRRLDELLGQFVLFDRVTTQLQFPDEW
jgi:hypothetical protein